MARSNRERPRNVPSFSGFRPSSRTSSIAKQHNASTGTAHEKSLQRELKALGLRFRKNAQSLPGKPDIVFPDARVVVFCDGDFWHGRAWKRLKPKLLKGANARYWTAKIASNIQRDRRINRELKTSGWQVLRLWETDIWKNAKGLAERVRSLVERNLARRSLLR